MASGQVSAKCGCSQPASKCDAYFIYAGRRKPAPLHSENAPLFIRLGLYDRS
jgi:hypothetical protein